MSKTRPWHSSSNCGMEDIRDQCYLCDPDAERARDDLDALAPEMAEVILLWDESEYCVGVGKGDPKPECEDMCICMKPAYDALTEMANKLRSVGHTDD